MKSVLALFVLTFVPAVVMRQGPSPQLIADELVAADRAFSAASAKTDLVSGLSAMFASDILMPNPNGIASGATEAVEALKANPINAGAKIEWSPVRVAVSGDGRHGFTAGFMTMHRADGTLMPLKYLAYWEKKPEGWRVLAYKRGQAKEVPAAMAVSYVLPKQIVEPAKDASTIEQYRNSLAAAETAFSNDAQKVGIGVAFTKYGSSEAINLGGLSTPTFVMGNEAIGASVGGGEPASSSPVRWGPDVRTIVAASGDFGVTIGHIYPNAPGPDPSTSSGQAASPAGRPFFTIWRKDAGGVWRYIAE